MSGIEQFPAAEVVLTDEERLMAVFRDFAVANTQAEAARDRVRNLTIRSAGMAEDFHAHEPALRNQNRPHYYYALGEVTDKIYQQGIVLGQHALTATTARRTLISTAQKFRGRKLHVESVLSEDSRQPIGALAYSRHDYTGPVIIDDLREAVGRVANPAIEGSSLTLEPHKPKRLGIKRLESLAVRMVGPTGIPLVKIEFLD